MPLSALLAANLRMILRDRILHAVLGVAALLLCLVPSLSGFSMRQVQELAVTLSLSAISLVLLVTTLLLGTSSIWRDVERRYTAAILTLPVSRTTYLLGKYCAIALFLIVCGIILAVAAALVITLAAAQYPSDLPIAWGNILLAIVADVVKFLLLASLAMLFSTVSTSFFLPFFGTLAIYLAGSASQEVYEYVTGQFGNELSRLFLAAAKGAYYLLPNFSAFNFKIYAVYALPLPLTSIVLPVVYAAVYSGLALGLAVWALNRRELP